MACETEFQPCSLWSVELSRSISPIVLEAMRQEPGRGALALQVSEAPRPLAPAPRAEALQPGSTAEARGEDPGPEALGDGG